jgi:hypothetical protein
MQRNNRLMVAVLVIAGLQLSACQQRSDEHQTEAPAHVERIEGTALSRVTLTEKAIQRIGLKTDQVREEKGTRKRKVMPYSALLYEPDGQTWAYTSPKPRTFVRHKVEVDYIRGDVVVLKGGLPTGTVVASVGVAELYGTEFKLGHIYGTHRPDDDDENNDDHDDESAKGPNSQ